MNIKYEKLSSELKQEIEKFHKQYIQEINDDDINIKESIDLWFEKHFEDWLNANYSVEKNQKREYARVDIELPIKVVDTLVDGVDHDQFGLDFIGTATNISRGGLYFNTNKPIEKSSIIKVIVDMSSIDQSLENINALAMVMRVEKIDDDNYGVGIMFSSIDEEKQSTLDTNIFKNFAYFLYK